ncbi:MAG: extracellular solute-binding protein [Firmicutes bacterium]|nr:extracellular solute-binding protein [Bacillota bacterium]
MPSLRRRLLGLLVAGLLVAASGVPVAAAWTGEIVLWDAPRWRDESGDQFHWIKAKIREFEASHPGVRITLVETPWAELPQKLAIAIAGRAWPDLAPVDISGGAINIQYLQQGVVEPLDAFFTPEELADFYPGALAAYTYGGKLYGIPTSMTVHSMLLALDHFRNRGVEPPANGRWTWDQFVETARKLTYDRNGDGRPDVWGFSTYILKGYYEPWPMLYMAGARPLAADLRRYTFDSPQAVSALQKVLDLKFKERVAPMELGSADVGGTFQAFANREQRRIAMEPWASWAIATLRTSEQYKMDFMGAEYPIGAAGQPVTIGGTGGWVVFHQPNKEKLAVVVELAKYLSTTQEQYAFARYYGTFPARQSVMALDPYGANEQMQQAAAMLPFAEMLPMHPNWRQIDERIQAQLQLAFAGEKSAEQALRDAGREVQSFLR